MMGLGNARHRSSVSLLLWYASRSFFAGLDKNRQVMLININGDRKLRIRSARVMTGWDDSVLSGSKPVYLVRSALLRQARQFRARLEQSVDTG